MYCELTNNHYNEVKHLFYKSIILLNNILVENKEKQLNLHVSIKGNKLFHMLKAFSCASKHYLFSLLIIQKLSSTVMKPQLP